MSHNNVVVHHLFENFLKCYSKAVLQSGSNRFNCYGILSIVFWKYAFQDNYTPSTSPNTRTRAAPEGHIAIRTLTPAGDKGRCWCSSRYPLLCLGAWRCSFAWNNVCGSPVERISLLLAVFRYEAGSSTSLSYISLFLGCWNTDDSLVGQLTRQGGIEKISSNGQIRHMKPLKRPFCSNPNYW